MCLYKEKIGLGQKGLQQGLGWVKRGRPLSSSTYNASHFPVAQFVSNRMVFVVRGGDLQTTRPFPSFLAHTYVGRVGVRQNSGLSWWRVGGFLAPRPGSQTGT